MDRVRFEKLKNSQLSPSVNVEHPISKAFAGNYTKQTTLHTSLRSEKGNKLRTVILVFSSQEAAL